MCVCVCFGVFFVLQSTVVAHGCAKVQEKLSCFCLFCLMFLNHLLHMITTLSLLCFYLYTFLCSGVGSGVVGVDSETEVYLSLILS